MVKPRNLSESALRRMDRLILTSDMPLRRIAERFGVNATYVGYRAIKLGAKTVHAGQGAYVFDEQKRIVE